MKTKMIGKCDWIYSSLTWILLLHGVATLPQSNLGQSCVDDCGQPLSPRLHVDHVKSPYGTSARVTFLWNEPQWNGAPGHYNVSCWTTNQKTVYLIEKPIQEKQEKKKKNDDSEESEEGEDQRQLIAQVDLDSNQQYWVLNGLAMDTTSTVSCQVHALTSGSVNQSPAVAETNTTTHSPSSIILAARNDGLVLIDTILDAVIGRINSGGFVAAVSLRGDIYGLQAENKLIRIGNDTLLDVEQIYLEFNSSVQLRSMAVDYIGRNLYFAGQEQNSFGRGSSIWKYNLDTQGPPKLIYSVSSGVKIVNMAIDPFTNVLYFTTDDGRKPQLQKLKMMNLELDSGSPSCELVSPALCTARKVDTDGNASLTAYVITSQGIVDAAGCGQMLNAPANVAWSSVDEMVILQTSVILRIKDQLLQIHRNDGSVSEMKISSGVISAIQAFSMEEQPMPDISCLKSPLDIVTDFRVYPINKTSAQINIDDSLIAEINHSNCPSSISFPQTKYVISICEVNPNVSHDHEKCDRYETYNNTLQISGLSRLVEYEVHVDRKNYYGDSGDEVGNHSQMFNTSQELRLAPAKLQSKTVTADKVLLTWERPDIRIPEMDTMKYKVSTYSMTKVKLHEEDDIECPGNSCEYVVGGLKPNTSYVFHVGLGGDKRRSEIEINKNEATGTTYASLGTLVAVGSNFTSTSIFLLWEPSNDAHVRNWLIQYVRVAEASWRDVNVDESSNRNSIYAILISKLRPVTQYKIRLLVFYDTGYNYTEEYTYLTNGRRRPRSPGTAPDKPIDFRIGEKSGKKYFLWDTPDEGGSQIEGYILESRQNPKDDWKPVATNIGGSETEYPLYPSVKVTPSTEFRLAATNAEGTGPWAITKSDGSSSGPPKKTIAIIIAVCVVVVLILVVATVLIACRRRLCGRKRGTQKEGLERLHRQLPGFHLRDASSHIDALSHISKDDLDALPHVSRNCITASRPLGQGAFGEVYEGLACNLPRIGPKSIRVAIKTLKEGSPDMERVKFLKEAILMSKFRHPNIVQLLGVCLESEPHWIILELMEGGDLLTYLRLARPTDSMPSQVTLEDLITLAVDVARGCAHLEQHHHVHRDLAARNCLVSSRDPAQRVVKIADFGMARDVYEGDYYRVEGHGLLPVRWMAPESMIDGVFTSKTDVWSFGVLLWEIMTLGQQPYPGRTNWDVMNYVRIGGRLQSPEFCPNELYEVMNSCWSFEAQQRPTFGEAAQRLESLRSLSQFQSDIPFPPFYPRYSGSTDSKENSAASAPAAAPAQTSDNQVQLFVTQASGRFQRNTKQGQSQPGKTNKLQKAAELLSFRKQKGSAPARPPPSKDEIDAGRSPSSLATTPDVRPTSSESFTTSTEGYEVPLLKNLNVAAGGFTNKAYEPTTPVSMSTVSIAAGAEEKRIPKLESKHTPSGRPESPARSEPTGSGRIKPKSPKPPLVPQVMHSSPRSRPRGGRESPPSSYENVPLD